MSPELDYKARELVRDAAHLYLSPDFTAPPDIAVMMHERGLGYEVADVTKISRYAAAAAGIQLLTDEAVVGSGVEARFADDYAKMPNEQSPKQALYSHIAHNFQLAAQKLKAPGGSERYVYLADRYTMLGKYATDMAFVDASLLENGSMLAHHGSEFVELSAAVLADDAETSALDTPDRVLVAHQLIPTVTGKASRHINYSGFVPNWMDFSTANVRLAHRKGNHALVDTDEGRPLFRVSPGVENRIKRYGPLIKCPAHQLLFSTETSLELGMHAVVNLGAKRGHYDTAQPAEMPA